jgi:outer membrane protein assembly factor BamA
MQGSLASVYIGKIGFGWSDVNYLRYGIDLRLYLPLFRSLSLGARTSGTLVSGGVIPTYARVFFGYRERIRGHFFEVLEGEDLVVGSLELRYAVLPAETFIFHELPVPMEFKVWRFGICLSAFVDAGAVWFRQDGLQLEDFRRGQGVGLNFLLPYSYVVRIEYAWNAQWRGQWIVDFRGSF